MKRRIDWLQAAGSLGILVGLILVALQMKQNSDLLAAQLAHAESDRYIAIETAAMGEDLPRAWAKALDEPQSLTLEEQIVVEGYMFSTIERWRSLHRVSEQGLSSQAWEPIVREDTSYYLAHPYGRAWWETFTSDPSVDYPPELVSFVTDELNTTARNYTRRYFSQMIDRITAQPATTERPSLVPTPD